MRASRLVVLLMIASLAAWALSACGGDDDAGGDLDAEPIAADARDGGTGADQVLKLGSIWATSGPGAAFGPQQVQGAELAVEQINADGGVEGATLELIQRDEAGEPEQAAQHAQALIEEEEVLALLGPTFSNSAAEAHPLADRLGVGMLATSNTGPGIVGECEYSCENVFRDSLGEETAIPANVKHFVAAADIIVGSGPQTAVVIHPDDDPFGATSAAIAQRAFADAGLIETSALQGWSGLRGALRMKPEVVMITASSGEAAAEMAQRLRRGGFKGGILGGNAFNSRLTGELAGAAGKGARSATAWFEGNPSEANRDFVAAYQEAYGESPDQFAAQAYTGVLLLAEAAATAELGHIDLAADRLALIEALREVEIDSPLGEIAFTPDHDITQPIWIVEMDGRGGVNLVEKLPAQTR